MDDLGVRLFQETTKLIQIKGRGGPGIQLDSNSNRHLCHPMPLPDPLVRQAGGTSRLQSDLCKAKARAKWRAWAKLCSMDRESWWNSFSFFCNCLHVMSCSEIEQVDAISTVLTVFIYIYICRYIDYNYRQTIDICI